MIVVGYGNSSSLRSITYSPKLIICYPSRLLACLPNQVSCSEVFHDAKLISILYHGCYERRSFRIAFKKRQMTIKSADGPRKQLIDDQSQLLSDFLGHIIHKSDNNYYDMNFTLYAPEGSVERRNFLSHYEVQKYLQPQSLQ